jgi:hypothetical protein
VHAPDAVFDQERDTGPRFGAGRGELVLGLKLHLGVENAEDVEDALPDLLGQRLGQVLLGNDAPGFEDLADALVRLDVLVDFVERPLGKPFELIKDLAKPLVRPVGLDLDDRALVEEEILEDLFPLVDQAAGLLAEKDVAQVDGDVIHGG